MIHTSESFSRFLLVMGFVLLQACTSAPKQEDALGDPWFRAARTSDIAVLKGMLEGGKPIDHTSPPGITALMVASRAGNPETVRWLLDHGADASKVDSDGQSALVYALVGLAKGPKLERIVEELIKGGANPFAIDKIGFQPVQEMIELELDAQIRKLKFSDKKPCDRVPPRTGEVSLSRMARRMENIPLAEFLEAQGCW